MDHRFWRRRCTLFGPCATPCFYWRRDWRAPRKHKGEIPSAPKVLKEKKKLVYFLLHYSIIFIVLFYFLLFIYLLCLVRKKLVYLGLSQKASSPYRPDTPVVVFPCPSPAQMLIVPSPKPSHVKRRRRPLRRCGRSATLPKRQIWLCSCFFFCTNSTTSPKIIHTWRVLENGCVGTWGLDSLIYDFHASFLRQISLVLKLFQFIGSFWDIVSDLYDHLPQNFKGFFYFESPILGCHTTRDVFVLGVTADTLSLAILRTFTTRIFASRPLHCNINSALFRLITR